MIVLTILIFLADFLMNKYFVGKYGGSKFGEYGAIIGVIIGCFVLPPFGIVVIPFILVLVIELIQGYDFKRAIKVVCFYSRIFSKHDCTSYHYDYYGYLVYAGHLFI